MDKKDLSKDISTITGISVNALNDLFKKECMCIGHDVFESITDGDSVSYIDLGIGVLCIGVNGGEVRYKFTPNRLLETTVANVVRTNTSPMINAANDALLDRFISAYKELL